MAVIDKIKVKIVIKESFHDLNQDATLGDLTMAYINKYPDFYTEFTMEEQMAEDMMDPPVAYKKIEQIVNDNSDVVLEQP